MFQWLDFDQVVRGSTILDLRYIRSGQVLVKKIQVRPADIWLRSERDIKTKL